MKSTVIAIAVAAGTLGFGSLSYAEGFARDGDERGDRRGYSQRDHREARQTIRAPQQPPVVPEYDHRQHNRYQQYGQHRQYDHYRQYDSHRRDGQWAARAHRFQRGEYVPYEYRQRHYHVNDWRSHQLYAPPYGHQWVRSDSGDYLLMAIATGLIVNLMLN